MAQSERPRRPKRPGTLDDVLGWIPLIDGPVLVALVTGDITVALILFLPWCGGRLLLSGLIGFWPWNFLLGTRNGG